METRINGKRARVSGVELRIGGECVPQAAGYFANAAEEHDLELQLQDYARLADNAQKRAARRALRKKKG